MIHLKNLIILLISIPLIAQTDSTRKVGNIMGVGDSMTLIEYLPKEQRWLEEVARRLGVIADNQAHGGWKLSQMIADSTTWAVPESWEAPKIATVHPVHNDFNSTDTALFRKQLHILFDALERRNFTIIAMTTAKYASYLPDGTDWGGNLNKGQLPYNHVLREVSNQRGAYLLDLWEIFDLENKNGNTDWMVSFGSDRHYNAEGCKIVENALYDFIVNNLIDKPLGLKLDIKCFLEGPYIYGSMDVSLRNLNLIPKSQPYNNDPWNYQGSEYVNTFPDNIVDWILLELRTDSNQVSNIRRAALLNSKGKIVDVDGINPVNISSEPGNYFIVIYHRNHIPVISAKKHYIENLFSYDFSSSMDKALGNNPMIFLGDVHALYSGDTDLDGIIDESDFLNVENNLFISSYNLHDVDMNGIVNVIDYRNIYSNYKKNSPAFFNSIYLSK